MGVFFLDTDHCLDVRQFRVLSYLCFQVKGKDTNLWGPGVMTDFA